MDETLPMPYVVKTLRLTAALAFVVTGLCWRYGQAWAIVPFLSGLALAVGLFVGWYAFIRRNITAQALKKNNGIGRGKALLLLFALVKYPLVGVLLWFVARHWETPKIVVFVGGFLFLQFVMVLRAIGKLLAEKKG
jgi:hypothetical protein